MKLTSPEFQDQGQIPEKYGIPRQNINPPLKIHDVPEETETLALIMDDPDAKEPAGKVWDHWIVFNIPSEVREIPENWEAKGIEGRTDFRQNKYGGPNPPDGTHTYVFKIYAVNTKIDLDEQADKKDLEKAMENHIIDRATIEADFDPIED